MRNARDNDNKKKHTNKKQKTRCETYMSALEKRLAGMLKMTNEQHNQKGGYDFIHNDRIYSRTFENISCELHSIRQEMKIKMDENPS